MAIPKILDGTAGPASESGIPSYTAVWNGSQWVPLGTTNALPVSQPGLSGGLVHDVIAVGVTAVLIPAVPDPARVGILVANTGATTLYFGNANVAAGNVANGAPPLAPGKSRWYAIGPGVLLYAIGSAAGGFCAYQEIKVATP